MKKNISLSEKQTNQISLNQILSFYNPILVLEGPFVLFFIEYYEVGRFRTASGDGKLRIFSSTLGGIMIYG